MKYQNEYIEYLISEKEKCSEVLDQFFLDNLDFIDLVEMSESFFNIQSYKKFVKSKTIDSLLGED